MLLIGHSHTEVVVAAAAAAGVPHVYMDLWWKETRTVDENGVRLTDQLQALMTGPVVSFVGGGTPAVFGLVAHPKPFDFVLPGDENLPLIEGAQIVPFDPVRHTMMRLSAEFFELIGLFARSGAGPVFHVDSPPAAFEETAPNDPLWVAFHGPSKAVSDPYLRLKCWRAHSLMVQEVCKAEGVSYIPPPPETLDERGFLKPEFAGTPSHGNQRYGERVLALIQERLAPKAPRKGFNWFRR